MSEPLLQVRGLSGGYHGVAVVHDLDLSIEPGEVVALLGPNGAGKSTTMNTISGLLPALGGEVRIAGHRFTHRRPHRMVARGLGYVAEDRGLFNDLTVLENLKLGLPRKNRVGRARQKRLEETFESFPALESLAGRQARLLSGGEQQMLAIARALLPRPKVLLVDEMSLGLAPLIVESLLPVIEAEAQRGAAVLLVEQHVQMALKVADRVIAMSRGRKELEVTSDVVRNDQSLIEGAYLGG